MKLFREQNVRLEQLNSKGQFAMSIEKRSDETYRWTNARQQYFGSIAANLIALTQGLQVGWVSTTLPSLASNDTPLLSGPISNHQLSWVGSINCIGALIGSFSVGYLTNLLGSKRTTHFLAVPYAISWLLIYYGNTYKHILIARFIGGMAGAGVETTVLLYITEISNDDIRGRLCSFSLFFRNIGTLFGMILGANVSYQHNAGICAFVPITFAAVFFMMPNTPRYYLERGQIQKAEDALKYYKGYNSNSNDQPEDYAIHKEFKRLKSITAERKHTDAFSVADFCKFPSKMMNANDYQTLRGILIGVSLSVFAEFSGLSTITSYAVTTFQKHDTSFCPYKSSIALAIALLLGSLTTTYLVDKFGRKVLILVSLLGSACGLLTASFYHHVNQRGYDSTMYDWVPMIALSLTIFVASAGIEPLFYVCSVENLPAKARTYGLAIICFSDNCVSFVSLKAYPILLESLDLHGCLIIYGMGCIFGAIFVLLVLKETRGKPLDEVCADV